MLATLLPALLASPAPAATGTLTGTVTSASEPGGVAGICVNAHDAANEHGPFGGGGPTDANGVYSRRRIVEMLVLTFQRVPRAKEVP